MTYKIYIFVLTLFSFITSIAQVPADSLTGTYAGKAYNIYDIMYNVYDDTTYVTLIDTTNCTLEMNNHFSTWGNGRRLYTRYYSCDTVIPPDYSPPPDTYTYTLFHSGDSLTDCEYNIPTNHTYYFFGKRISHYTAGINSLDKYNQFNIYPNPATDNLTIETQKSSLIEILNINGQNIKSIFATSTRSTIDLTELSCGVYIIRLVTDKEVITKKLIKE